MASRIFKQQTLQKVTHDKTLAGDGTPQVPLGVADGAFLTSSSSPTLTGNWTFNNAITVPAASIPLDRLPNISGHSVMARSLSTSGPMSALAMSAFSVLARINAGTTALQSLVAGQDTVLRRTGVGDFDFGKLTAAHLDGAGNITSITTNANGTSVRFQLGSLGIQLCFHTINLGSRIAAGTGTYANPYRTASADWTFPESFDSSPVCSASNSVDVGGIIARLQTISWDSQGTTQMLTIRSAAVSDDATVADVIAHLWAIGTWTP